MITQSQPVSILADNPFPRPIPTLPHPNHSVDLLSEILFPGLQSPPLALLHILQPYTYQNTTYPRILGYPQIWDRLLAYDAARFLKSDPRCCDIEARELRDPSYLGDSAEHVQAISQP